MVQPGASVLPAEHTAQRLMIPSLTAYALGRVSTQGVFYEFKDDIWLLHVWNRWCVTHIYEEYGHLSGFL